MSDFSHKVAQLFEGIGPRNHLLRLADRDRQVLCAFLVIHAQRPTASSERLDEVLGEKAGRAGREAGKLADKLQAEVFGGPLNPAVRPFLRGFETLPEQLRALARRLTILESIGKPGRKLEAMGNFALVQACEFVHLKLGKNYYEDLAELYQAIARQDVAIDFSAEAIRRRTDRFRKEYPMFYEYGRQTMKSLEPARPRQIASKQGARMGGSAEE